MGMTGGLYRASTAEIRKLVEEPKSIEAFFEASAWAPPVREVRPKGVLGWLMKLSPVRVFENDPDAAPPPDYDRVTDRPHVTSKAFGTACTFFSLARHGKATSLPVT